MCMISNKSMYLRIVNSLSGRSAQQLAMQYRGYWVRAYWIILEFRFTHTYTHSMNGIESNDLPWKN